MKCSIDREGFRLFRPCPSKNLTGVEDIVMGAHDHPVLDRNDSHPAVLSPDSILVDQLNLPVGEGRIVAQEVEQVFDGHLFEIEAIIIPPIIFDPLQDATMLWFSFPRIQTIYREFLGTYRWCRVLARLG
jgi:hypothetical protein